MHGLTPLPSLSPRCREGHHKFDQHGICSRPGCGREKKQTATDPILKIVDGEAPKFDDKPSAKVAAIAKLKGATVPDTSDGTDGPTPAETPDDKNAIHIADLVSPGVIEIEVLAGKFISKKFLRREIGEITSDDKGPPTDALKKWIKIRWPKLSTTPFGEMLMSQLLFVATLQLKSKPLAPRQPAPDLASTVSRDTNQDRATVQRVDMPLQSSQPDRVPIPTPKEL